MVQKSEKVKQKGFSGDVFNTDIVQDYIESCKGGYVGGYLGHDTRTIERDAMLEAILIYEGFTSDEIAVFLTHSEARHIMNELPRGSTIRMFAELIKKHRKLISKAIFVSMAEIQDEKRKKRQRARIVHPRKK